jgi:hypothetical protein
LVRRTVDAGHPEVSLDRDSGVPHGLKEHIEERRAVHAETEPFSAEHTIPHVEDDTAGGQHTAEEAIETAPEGQNAFAEPEFVEHGQSRRLQDQARSDRAGSIELLEERDAMSVTVEQKGG